MFLKACVKRQNGWDPEEMVGADHNKKQQPPCKSTQGTQLSAWVMEWQIAKNVLCYELVKLLLCQMAKGVVLGLGS